MKKYTLNARKVSADKLIAHLQSQLVEANAQIKSLSAPRVDILWINGRPVKLESVSTYKNINEPYETYTVKGHGSVPVEWKKDGNDLIELGSNKYRVIAGLITGNDVIATIRPL